MICVGIDFDNTLIDYRQLFARAAFDLNWIDNPTLSKATIKATLINQDDNDNRWQQLQTAVYSRYIEDAQPYPGAKAFCEQVMANGDRLMIFSHKTRFSNFDGRTELIEPARAWLSRHGLVGENGLLPAECVGFYETRAQKLMAIAQCSVDWFVDDLAEVLLEDQFPEATLPILFADKDHESLLTTGSWQDLSAFYEVCQITGVSMAMALVVQFKALPRLVEKLQVGGNNQLFKIDWKCQTVIAKTATQSAGLANEFDALTLLESQVTNVPVPLAYDSQSGVLVETALSGKPITTITNHHVDGAVDFLVQLDALSRRKPHYSMASHARNNLASYPKAVDDRLKHLKSHLFAIDEPERHLATALIEQKLDGVWQIVKRRFLEKLHAGGLNLAERFAADEMILSPSDYGFHNMLATDEGHIQVCDFEYFGWDDKAKLVADFFHHQGQQLTDGQRLHFIAKGMKKKILNRFILQRLELVLDIIGIEWVLIVLNIIDKGRLQLKLHSGAYSLNTAAEVLNRQIGMANALLDVYMQRMDKPHLFITSSIDLEQWKLCYV